MIVIGLTGGMGQGKSTVGRHLRELAGVDYKADLEFSYPISEVLNDWIKTWNLPLELAPNEQLLDLANRLLVTLPPILEKYTGKTAELSRLLLTDSPESLKVHDRLIDYLGQWLILSDAERSVQLPLPIKPENKALHRSLLQWLGGSMIELVDPNIWSDVIGRRIQQLEGRGYSLVTVGGIRYKQDMEMIHANDGLILRVVRPNTETSSNITESAMSEVVADMELINNGTLQDLEAAVKNLWQDLQSGKPKDAYQAV